MHLSPDDVALLEATVEIEIETQADATSLAHRTIVWVVTDGPDAFIRSVNGSRARWYREVSARPAVTIRVGDRTIPARAIAAVDTESIARTSASLARKYAGDPDLASMLVPSIFDTTLRLEPA